MTDMVRHTLFDTTNIVDVAIQRLKTFEPEEGYYLAFSGGKDSCVIKAIADMARVKYDAYYSLTTIDPPDVVYFIKKYHKDVIIERPPKPFLQEMINRGFALRQSRWCCEYLKEKDGDGRRVITGIRWAESIRRTKRKFVESYKNKIYINPIIDWSDDEVWSFIRNYSIPYCSLYDDGWKRIGCLFCPLTTRNRREIEAERYPRYVTAFKNSFEKLYQKRKSEGNKSIDRWTSGEDMFNWWMNGSRGELQDYPDQCLMFE